MSNCRLSGAFVILIAGVLAAGAAHARGAAEHQLGPTGIIGTISKTTVRVTKVDKGSPADGKVKVGDQIIGAGDAKFKKDVRREMADAIDEAETEEAGGRLTLILKGDKKVELTLEVLGSYSDTAPYNCPKSERVIARAAEHLAKGKIGSVAKTELLGLLATGEEKYIDFVKKYVHDKLASEKDREFNPDPEKMEKLLEGTEDAGYVCWSYGYTLTFLCEYYFMTRDEAVLPGIKTYAVTLARGQGPVGTYGHRLATAKLNWQIRGYGAMNQPSLTCIIGMFLAQKAGVRDPRLDKGAKISYDHYAAAIGKCAFNYGSIGNTRAFNNNGTSGSAAVAFSAKGNREGAKFFATLSAASHGAIETGHTGHFFNVMWTPLGANIGGPELTKQFFRKTRWLQTLYRTWDGRFTFDGGGYKRCNSTGAHLLFYCTPRRKLYITGKGSEKSWLSAAEAAEAVDLASLDCSKMSSEEVLRIAMEHPIPQVSRKGVGTLAQKLEELKPTLLEYLESGTDQQRSIVAQACGWWIPDEKKMPYFEGLVALLRDKNASLDARQSAAGSLCYFKEKAKVRPYFMDMVAIMAESRDAAIAMTRNVGQLVEKGPFTDGLVTDPQLLYRALIPILTDKEPKVRGPALNLLRDIPLEDFHLIADAVIWSLENEDGSSSAHNPGHVVVPAIAILAHHNIKEGLEYAKKVREMPGGKGSFKINAFLRSLAQYGSAAKPFVEENGRFEDYGKNRKLSRAWREMISAIDGDKKQRRLISLEEAKRRGR